MSQTMTATRQPRGWDSLIAQLTTLTERPAFVRGILELQCRIVAAEYGAIWELGPEGKPVPTAAWPASLEQQGPDTDVLKMLGQAAQGGMERGLSHVLKIEVPGEQPGSAGAHIFVTILRVGGQPVGCTTVVADCRDPDVIHKTVPMRELAGGLYEGFFARLDAAARAREAEQVRQAMAVLAVAQEGKGFKGACLNLVNELARQLRCDRVSVGWQKGRLVKLVAMSDTDQLKRHSDEAGQIEIAMAECIDQKQPLMAPLPEDAEPLLAQAVIFSHKKLISGRDNANVLSVPLRHGDEHVGVFTLEREGKPFDAALVQRLQLLADVLGPQLADRYESDRLLVGHAWRSVKWTGSYLVGPKHVGWKLLGLTVLTVLMLTLVVPWPYRVSSDFRLEAHERRVLPVPYQGKLAVVHVRPGDKVTVGQVLAELDSQELRLQLAEATGRLRLSQVEHDQAKGEGKQADAAKASANIMQHQARVDLLTYQISMAKITSPVEGVVLDGYWVDKVGSMLELGTNLFEVAPLAGLTPVLKVHESDINAILEALSDGRATLEGELATRSVPELSFAIAFDRIVPLGKPVEGKNVFEVWCKMEEPATWMRPGMEGIAKLDIDRRPIFWLLTHRIIDTLRLWLWL